MKSLVRFLAIGLLVCFAASAQGQIVGAFSTTTSNPAVGQTFAVDFRITAGLVDMTALEFPIKFDPTVLEAVSVTASQVPGMVISADPNASNVTWGLPNNFGPAGRIYASWLVNFSQFSNGWTPVNPNIRIFTINFKALKDCVTSLKIEKTLSSDKIEFLNAQTMNLSYNIPQFNITVGSGNCPVPPPTYTGVKVITNNIYIPQGEIGCMPITSNEFKDIEAFQYSIKWNTISTLNYEGVRAFGNRLPGFDPGLFAGFNTQGYQAGGWASTAGKVTIPNVIAPMYEVCFTGKGAAGASTYVTPSDMGVSPAIETPIGGGLANNLWTPTTPVGDTAYIVSSPPPTGTVVFKADVDTVAPNMETCVDIRAINFKGLEYAEFAILYDTTKIRYKSINLGTNPLGLTAVQNEYDLLVNPSITKGVRHVSIEQNAGAGDTLRYVQFRYYGTPATVADNVPLFSVCFKAVGPVGTNAAVDVASYANKVANFIVPIGAWKAVPISGVPVQVMDGNVFVKSPLSATLSPTNPTCNGGTNGSVNTTTGANSCAGGNITYKWAGPGINAGNMNVPNPTNLTAGTYTVTLTCSAGPVTATATVTLTQPNAVSFANAPAIVGVTCPNDANGSITLSVTGGTAPYNYSWNGPSTVPNTPNATNLKAGNYRVTVTDANNCAFNNNNNAIIVGSPQGISATATTNPVKCMGGSDGTISLSVSGGTPPYTVQWSGPNGFTGTGTSLSGLKSGNYTPTITDSKQCTQVGQVVIVDAPTAAMTATTAPVGDVVCFNTSTGRATVTVANGMSPFTYAWRNVSLGTLVSIDKDPLNLACGTYTVVVTDNKGCTASGTAVTINCPTALLTATATPTAATCGTNGKICLSINGGWSNKTITWSNPALSGECPSGVGSGTYTATITDEKGCSVTATTTVAGPPQFNLDNTLITNLTCFGAGNGAITVNPTGGAGGPYVVNWSGTANLTGPTISNLQPGNYVPVVTDKEGCSQTFPAYTVTSPDAIAVVDTNVTHQVGSGNNGAIEITGVTGGTSPYTFSWAGPNGYTSNKEDIDILAPGVYTVTIKDGNNCTFTASYQVKADFSATATLKKGACGLSADGCITVTIQSTAPGPYTVSWPGNANPVSIANTPADICAFAGGAAYTLTVTNSAGQVFTMQPVSVPVLDAPMYSTQRTDPNEDLKNGSIKINPVPANAPLGYEWSNGESGTKSIIQLDSGSYTVTITHFLSGCTTVETFHLERKYQPAVFNWIEVTNPKCKGSTDGVLRIQFTGADGPGYKYKWAGPTGVIAGATTTTLGGIGAGTYTITVTDERGLDFVYDTVLVAQSLLAITTVDELSNINGFQVSGSTVCDGVALVSYSGQVGAVNIAWSNGVTTANNSTLCGGAYSVTVTDALGCSSVWTDALTAPPALAATGQTTLPVTCAGECDGKARVTVSGGVAPYQVSWSNGQKETITSASGFSEAVELCGGTYTITVTDKSGITTVYTHTVQEPAPVSLAFASQQPSAFTTCDGEIIATATGATGVSTWTWSVVNRPGKTGNEQRADGLCAGEVVQFTVVDANGCSAVGRDSVPYPPDGCLKIGPVITPNGDNLNDYFGITCIQGLKNVLEIYNRWGQLVYTAENYDSAPGGFLGTKYWDGTSNGQELPEGSYFYVLNYTDEDGNEQQIKGYITLLR